jgi:hypothetical protein
MTDDRAIDLGKGENLELITCSICFSVVMPRFIDQHIAHHQVVGDIDD